MLTKKQEFVLAVIWPALVIALCLYLKLNIIVNIILFYVVPATYYSYKIPGQVKKSLTFAFIGGLILSCFDYIWELTGAWITPTIFPFKFLGVASVENILWSFAWIYFVVSFYEYFFEKDFNKEKTATTTYRLFAVSCLGFLLLLVVVFVLKINLSVPYSYLVLGTLLSLPALYLLLNYPNIRSKFIRVGAYFFYQSLMLELAALYLGYWYFPQSGQFIGKVTLLGLTFPFEEFVLFITFGSVIVLSWYELFDDDRR